jgi:glycine betaine/proline transport system permease protein
VPPTSAQRRRRRVLEVALGALAAVLAYLSHTYLWAATFAESWFGQQSWLNLGTVFSNAADTSTTWVQDTFPVLTGGFKNVATAYVLDPVQQLLADSPWYVTSAAIVALALIIGGRWAAVTAAVCLALLMETGLWQDAMVTLASTLLATLVVLALGVVVGVAMGRSGRVDAAVRPLLDAAQVLPAFVYLVPFLALFDRSRFSAIAAAVVYAAPVSIKIIADGIRAVSPPTVEAATAAGSSTWQLIRKVQLPMSASALTLAANQGLIYVLSMVVVGGLVGAGALGYDVVAGFSKAELMFGKGLAAGLAIVLLGIMLDRITQAASRRLGRPGH